jgi:hypothetical protein
MIDIPYQTPLGRKIHTIGVWVSGGADSALLCYLLAKKIKQESLSYKILPMTVDYKRPFQNIGGQIVNKIKSITSSENIFLEHISYTPNNNEDWYGDTLLKVFHDKNYENFKTDKIQILYSAITTNPPTDIQNNFTWGVLSEVETKRGENVQKEKIRYFIKEENNTKYEFIEYKPFFDINKKKIAQLYRENNLTESLFPLTRSCEKLGTVIGHCGQCWWCEERLWAFGKL